MAERLVKGMKGMSFLRSFSNPQLPGVDSPPAPEKKEKKSFLQRSKKKSYTRPGNSVGPLASARYLLQEDEPFLEPFPPHLDSPPLRTPIDSPRFRSAVAGDSASLNPSSSSSSSSLSSPSSSSLPLSSSSSSSSSSYVGCGEEQVVVLKVSLHCKGCEGKVRRHLARLEGVRSLKIEFEAKKVTVTGHVTPLGVLTSVSKVKKAEFWPLT